MAEKADLWFGRGGKESVAPAQCNTTRICSYEAEGKAVMTFFDRDRGEMETGEGGHVRKESIIYIPPVSHITQFHLTIY